MDKLVTGILSETQMMSQDVDFKELDGKTILITGASGLMGVHFLGTIRNIISAFGYNIKIYCISKSEPTGYFKSLADFKECSTLWGDITDISFLNSLPKADYIIHAAGYGQPGRFMEDQIKTLKLNTFSTFELFNKLNENGKFLFISTSELYSGLENAPFNETQIGSTNTNHPRACYIEGKRCGEAVVNSYRKKGVEAKSARLSLAYGPGTQRGDQRVLNSFIEKALKGNINMMDEGKALRTYCYITDAIHIMWHILLEGKDAIYNVGGKSKISIKELAEMIASILKVKVISPQASQTLEGAPDNVSLDMTRAEKEFHKINYISLQEGLKKTIEWQKELYVQ